MTRVIRSIVAAALLAAVAAPVAPASARVRACAPTATPDAFEPDGSPAAARPITLPDYGAAPLDEAHTFDVADQTSCDEDWVSFTVTDAQADAGYVVLLEAFVTTYGVRPVIEVYAPGAVPTTPTALSGTADPAATATSLVAPWVLRGGASLEFRPDSSGPGAETTYLVRVRPMYGTEEGFGDAAGAYRLRAKLGMTTRLYGADRHSTAARISYERFADGSVGRGAAVVANGYVFADALAGSTLAGALGAPLLTTGPTALPLATRQELQRLGVRTVYLLGGTKAVATSVSDELTRMGLQVVRVKGADRYATAAAIARAADATATSGAASLAFVVSGRVFPDALCASAVAAHGVAPVLLTEPSALSSATADAISDPALGITDVVIVGGTSVVSTATEEAIAAMCGADHVRRLSGPTRYATAREVAVWATGGGGASASTGTTASPAALQALGFSRVGLASAADFPDGLAGGVFCGLAGSPLLLTESWRVSPYIEARLDPADAIVPGMDYYGAGTQGLTRAYAFGGSASLGVETVAAFDQLTGARF